MSKKEGYSRKGIFGNIIMMHQAEKLEKADLGSLEE